MTHNNKTGISDVTTHQTPPLLGTTVLLPKWLDARLTDTQALNTEPSLDSDTNQRAACALSFPDQARSEDASSERGPHQTRLTISEEYLCADHIFLAHQGLTPIEPHQQNAYDPALCPNPLLVMLHALRAIEQEQQAAFEKLCQTQPDTQHYFGGLEKRLHLMQEYLIRQSNTLPTQPNCSVTMSTKALYLSEPLPYPDQSTVHLHLAFFPAHLHLCVLAKIITPKPGLKELNSELNSEPHGEPQTKLQFIAMPECDQQALNQYLQQKH